MITAPATATHLAAFLANAELIAATSATARDSVVIEDTFERSFSGVPSWRPPERYGRFSGCRTSVSESTELALVNDQLHNDFFAELGSYRTLAAGWDGENAAKPSERAISEAARFARIAGGKSNDFEPTLHVDGSVILELSDGQGSLRFKGDGQVAYALSEIGYGVARFDGFTIPEALRPAFPV